MPLQSTSPAKTPDNLTAALLLTVAVLMFTIETVVVRWLGAGASVWQAVFFRGVGQVIVVLCWMLWRRRWVSLKTGRPGLHIARGLVSISGWWLYYWTFQQLGIALATLLTFASSLFVVVLAGPVLGERVRPVSWIATLVGFGGIAVATGVGTVSFDAGVVIGLVAAALSAAIVFLTRALALTEDTLTIMTYIGLFVMTAAIPMAWWTWVPLGTGNALLLMGVGILGALGMVLMIEAYGRGEAAVLAPIPYIRLALAMGMGYLIFGEVPELNMVVGAVIVVLSALWALGDERRRIRDTTGS